MKAILPVSLVLLGLLMVAVGLSWSSLFPATAQWTPEKEEKLSSLGQEVTRLRFAIIKAENNPNMHAGESAATLKAQHAEVEKEYNVSQKEFESATDSPSATGRTLKWLGITVTAIGAVFALANRDK